MSMPGWGKGGGRNTNFVVSSLNGGRQRMSDIKDKCLVGIDTEDCDLIAWAGYENATYGHLTSAGTSMKKASMHCWVRYLGI